MKHETLRKFSITFSTSRFFLRPPSPCSEMRLYDTIDFFTIIISFGIFRAISIKWIPLFVLFTFLFFFRFVYFGRPKSKYIKWTTATSSRSAYDLHKKSIRIHCLCICFRSTKITINHCPMGLRSRYTINLCSQKETASALRAIRHG